MACANFIGNESQDGSEYRSTGGTWSIVATPFSSLGDWALKLEKVGSATVNARVAGNRADGRPNGEMNISTAYFRGRFMVETAPASNEEQIMEFTDTGASTKAYVTINSSRNLKIYNNAGSLIATGSTALSLSTEYEISVKISTGSGNTPYEILIDGVTEVSGTLNSLTGNHGSIYLGVRTNLNAQNMTIYWDDVWVDDSAYPTSGFSIVRVAPDANSSPAGFTSGTGASDYTQVDEAPPSTADYIQSGASAASHFVTLQNTSTVGISGTILGFKAQMMAREVTSGTSSNRLAIKSGSTTAYTDAFNHSTSNQHICKITEVDPDTSAAWTTSGIDGATIGIDEANAIAMRCFFMSGYVAFVPAAPPSSSSNFKVYLI